MRRVFAQHQAGIRVGGTQPLRLYALKVGTDMADAAVFKDPSVPRSDVEIVQVGDVPNSETASFIRRVSRVYRITGISGNHIALERQPDERFDAEGKLLGNRPMMDLTDLASGKKYHVAGAVGFFVLMVFVFTPVRQKRTGAKLLSTRRHNHPLVVFSHRSRPSRT